MVFEMYYVWGGGREDQPHVQGDVAAWAQEGLEELSHVEGQDIVTTKQNI